MVNLNRRTYFSGSTSSESDDSPHRIVGGNSNGDPVSWHYLDSETPHAAAQLREHLMPGVTLNPVKAAAVHRHNRSLHID